MSESERTKESTKERCYDIIEEMINSANKMKGDINSQHWNDFEEKTYLFTKLQRNACYWAPEIIRHNFWQELHIICSVHFNNCSNPIHRELFEIYKNKYAIEQKMCFEELRIV